MNQSHMTDLRKKIPQIFKERRLLGKCIWCGQEIQDKGIGRPKKFCNEKHYKEYYSKIYGKIYNKSYQLSKQRKRYLRSQKYKNIQINNSKKYYYNNLLKEREKKKLRTRLRRKTERMASSRRRRT